MNTIAIDFNTKLFEIDGEIFNLRIWDTAGQERFRTITYSYYRDADGIIIVYDVTKPQTFESIKNWLDEIRQYAKPNVSKLIVGNKCDLTLQKSIDYNVAKEFADKIGVKLLETSAKDAINVEEAFKTLTSEIAAHEDCDTESELSPSINISKQAETTSNCCF